MGSKGVPLFVERTWRQAGKNKWRCVCRKRLNKLPKPPGLPRPAVASFLLDVYRLVIETVGAAAGAVGSVLVT